MLSLRPLQLTPMSEHGRVLAAVLAALLSIVLILAWTPAEAYDSEAPKAETADKATLNAWVTDGGKPAR